MKRKKLISSSFDDERLFKSAGIYCQPQTSVMQKKSPAYAGPSLFFFKQTHHFNIGMNFFIRF